MSPLPRFAGRLIGLGRYQKRAIQVIVDFCAFSAVLIGLLMMRYRGALPPLPAQELILLSLAPLLSLLLLFYFDVYRMVLRYVTSDALLRIIAAMTVSTAIWFVLAAPSFKPGMPRTVLIGYPIVGTLVAWTWRQAGRWILNAMQGPQRRTPGRYKNVIIYGAGTHGMRLVNVLNQSPRFNVVGIVDKNDDLWGRYVAGFRVLRPSRLVNTIVSKDVHEIVLAMPDANRSERRAIVASLEGLGVPVRTMPTYEELANRDDDGIASLRPVGAVELLGREPVQAIPELLGPPISGKCVLITGAGGSIGSEIVRQILPLNASKVVLFEAAETALFAIEQDAIAILAKLAAEGKSVPTLVPVIGNVRDARAMTDALRKHGVQIIYHAAAHKHVPLVEANPMAGLENNSLGTITAAEVAEANGVERFVLVSTDKAVRPTNVMGASKRLAEIALQKLAATPGTRTVFAIVRFGNVLDSSGSVLPIFRKQIEAGGPVTVTHPNIIRYFMSIPEAASLVVQAGAMAKGGEVFVLDMGEPVKIAKLAESMIRLMGLDVKDDANPDGDIAIKYIGLRPGEKLFEELFLGKELEGTRHPSIMASSEPIPADFDKHIERLRGAIETSDVEVAKQVLVKLVEGYQPAKVSDPQSSPASPDARNQRVLH